MIDPAIAAQLGSIATAELSDNLQRMNGIQGLRPFHAGGVLVGSALTVKTRAGDNKTIHEAMAAAQAGDVLVVDGEGDVSRALVGEIMMEMAIAKGVAGFVIDGAIRDSAAFAASSFPCFARSVTYRGPYKEGPGTIGAPVSIGGWVVKPGDIVVGDADGVVTFDPGQAEELILAARKQQQREAELLASIRKRHALVPE